MEIEAIHWLRQREIHTLLCLIDSKIDRLLVTGGCPMPTSPPSSSSRTGMPSRIRSNSWERLAAKMQREALSSLIMWVAGKLGSWLLTLTIPALLTFGALAWKWLGPFLKWVME